jgi:virulence-associated protein VagC
MAEKAQIVDEGGRQTVRLPESVRFPDGQREVTVRREGRRIVLEPIEPARSSSEWSPEFLATFGSVKEEIERLPQTPITELKDPFE